MQCSLPLLLLLAFLTGCTKQHEETEVGPEINPGRIVINEVVNGASVVSNEFGENADWVELHNPGPTITLEAGSWWLTDDEGDPYKFELPELVVPEDGFVTIWCDGHDVVLDEVHVNFELSQHDGHLRLVHQSDADPIVVDQVELHDATSGDRSMGRIEDGSGTWAVLATQTPGERNTATD